MRREFDVPSGEGPMPKPSIHIKRINESELNIFQIGSLERSAFHELSPWTIIPQEDVDIAYRVGLKTPVFDDEGAVSSLYLLFGAFLYDEEDIPSEKKLSEKSDYLYSIFESTLIQYAEKYNNLMGLFLPTPQYMLDELKEQVEK